MFGIGPWEIVVIAIVALIFIKPSDLPAVLRKVGRFFAELRSLRDDVTRSLSEVEREVEREIERGVESSAAVESGSTRAGSEPDGIAKRGGNGRSSDRRDSETPGGNA